MKIWNSRPDYPYPSALSQLYYIEASKKAFLKLTTDHWLLPMPIPFSYSYRNLLARRLTTLLTAVGMALVVFVFAAVLMLSEGLRRTLVATGSYDNVVVLRAGSESEVQSAVDRDQAGIIALSARSGPG